MQVCTDLQEFSLHLKERGWRNKQGNYKHYVPFSSSSQGISANLYTGLRKMLYHFKSLPVLLSFYCTTPPEKSWIKSVVLFDFCQVKEGITNIEFGYSLPVNTQRIDLLNIIWNFYITVGYNNTVNLEGYRTLNEQSKSMQKSSETPQNMLRKTCILID